MSLKLFKSCNAYLRVPLSSHPVQGQKLCSFLDQVAFELFVDTTVVWIRKIKAETQKIRSREELQRTWKSIKKPFFPNERWIWKNIDEHFMSSITSPARTSKYTNNKGQIFSQNFSNLKEAVRKLNDDNGNISSRIIRKNQI